MLYPKVTDTPGMPTDSPTVAARRSRLSEWIATHYCGQQSAFVAATKINQGELSALLRDKSFGEKRAATLEIAAGMPDGYLVRPLAFGEHQPMQMAAPLTDMAEHIVRVEQSGEAGMGDGRENEDYPDVIHTVEYSHGFIRDLIGFLPPAGRLKLTTGRGDSMMPTIQPGDAVLYDSGVSRFDGDGIYLVNLGHGQQIKRLRDSGDIIYVVSDNTAYAPIPFPKNAFIAGKVYLKNKIERFA